MVLYEFSFDINKIDSLCLDDVNSNVHSHLLTQFEGEFSPLNYGVTLFSLHQGNTSKNLVFINGWKNISYQK